MSQPELVDADGMPLRQRITKRRRQTSLIKHKTPHGDVLFKLIVDLPEGMGEDDFNRVMAEYFGVGQEAFRRKTKL